MQFMDMEHPEWGWNAATSQELKAVIERLRSYERMTWRQILAMRGKKGPYNGPIAIPQIAERNPDAAERIGAFKEVEAAGILMKLRIDGKHRVWGITRGQVCFLFWNDPKHTVWR